MKMDGGLVTQCFSGIRMDPLIDFTLTILKTCECRRWNKSCRLAGVLDLQEEFVNLLRPKTLSFVYESKADAARATPNKEDLCPEARVAWGDMYERAGPVFWNINQPYVDTTPLAGYNGEEEVLALAGLDAERFDAMVKEPMRGRRPGFAHEIDGTVDMLCSAESGWTTGSVICANSGMKMSIA